MHGGTDIPQETKGNKKGKHERRMHPERTGAPADHIKHVPDDGRHMNQRASSKGCS